MRHLRVPVIVDLKLENILQYKLAGVTLLEETNRL